MIVKISVLINTLNEEKNIRNCLECVSWADEIVVVDMHSDDKTVEIAKEYTDRIFMHERLGYADPARKFALEQATGDWILVVDADELVPVTLRDSLVEIVKTSQYDAVSIPHRNYFFGHPMKGSGWGPLQDMHIRFFKKEMMTYSDRVHAFAQLNKDARVFQLLDDRCAFIHFNYLDVEHFLDKLNRYTTIEAENALVAGEAFSAVKLFPKIAKEFIIRYVRLKGYKDGFQGLAMCLMMAFYRLSSALKLSIMERYNKQSDVRKPITAYYHQVAQEEIAKYK